MADGTGRRLLQLFDTRPDNDPAPAGSGRPGWLAWPTDSRKWGAVFLRHLEGMPFGDSGAWPGASPGRTSTMPSWTT